MTKTSLFQIVCIALFAGLSSVIKAQDGNRIPPSDGQTAKSVLADVQARVHSIQTLNADLEFDRKDDDGGKKKKKKKAAEGSGINPAWPEPPDRDIERGPLSISRGNGAYLFLERKKEKEEFIANPTSLWKHDIDDKEARHIPASWPIVDTFVSNALKMNVFVAMDDGTIKLKGTESVDGVPCWVLQGNSPSRLNMVGVGTKKMQMWVGQADGIPRVIKVPSEEDTIIRLKNVRINQAVDPTRFQFTPPAGVKTKNVFGL